MAQYPLGIIIRQRRDMLGLSQQQLCQGICDRSTLSRIERGDQLPSYYTLHALLQRLGMQEKDIRFFLSQPDFETAQPQKEIVALNTRKQWLQAQQKIRQLQALPTAADPLTRQFILRAKALAGYEQDGKAVPYLYEQLMHYPHNLMFNNEALLTVKPLLCYNYSRLLGRERRYEECIEVAEIGRQCCVMYNKCKMLGGLLHNIAYSLHELGEDDKSKEILTQAYYVHKAMERNSSCEAVKKYAEETFGLTIEPSPRDK